MNIREKACKLCCIEKTLKEIHGCDKFYNKGCLACSIAMVEVFAVEEKKNIKYWQRNK